MNFERLKEMSEAYKASRIIQVACDLNVFDLVADGAKDHVEIAKKLSTDGRATMLLCNALAGMGLMKKREGRFSNSEVSSKYLVTSSPLYFGWIIRHNSNSWGSWGQLEGAIKSGKLVSGRAHMNKDDDELMHEFIMGMHSLITARGDAELVVDRLNLSAARRLLDLGGGPATFSMTFCRRIQKLEAVVFDLPETVAIARENLAKNQDVKEKIGFVEGDFLKDELPRGFDVVFISNIIHMLNERENLALMKKAFGALNPGGRIVVKDHLLNEDLTLPSKGSIFSLHMLLHTNGRDYGFHEVREWLREAGCCETNVLDIPKGSPFELMVGVKRSQSSKSSSS